MLYTVFDVGLFPYSMFFDVVLLPTTIFNSLSVKLSFSNFEHTFNILAYIGGKDFLRAHLLLFPTHDEIFVSVSLPYQCAVSKIELDWFSLFTRVLRTSLYLTPSTNTLNCSLLQFDRYGRLRSVISFHELYLFFKKFS